MQTSQVLVLLNFRVGCHGHELKIKKLLFSQARQRSVNSMATQKPVAKSRFVVPLNMGFPVLFDSDPKKTRALSELALSESGHKKTLIG